MNHYLTVAIVLMTIITFAYVHSSDASHGTDKSSCTNDGLYDGKNNPFSIVSEWLYYA